MIKVLTEVGVEQTHLSLHLSKYHIVARRRSYVVVNLASRNDLDTGCLKTCLKKVDIFVNYCLEADSGKQKNSAHGTFELSN